MATRSRIALVHRDGTLRSIYAHWGGSPIDNGVILRDHYCSFEKVHALVALGSISVLDEHLEPPSGVRHTFYTRCPSVTLAYHRDRGDTLDITDHTNHEALLHHKGYWEEYLYVFDNGRWFAYDTHGPMPVPVEIPAAAGSAA